MMLAATGLGLVLLFWHWAIAAGVFAAFLGLGVFVQQNEHRKAGKLRTPSCGHITDPARYLGWDGSLQTFEFANESIATELMGKNSQKLVNVAPEHRALLVSAPAATTKRPSLQVFDEAIRRIETAKTPAGRRSALARALADLPPELRENLNLEASRIEVEAALEKVDGLKTKAAKLRCLSQALEAVRADDVDDALQAKQIGWLEEAIAATNVEN